MKKPILFVAVFCITICLQAQTQKSWYIIGGSLASIGGNTTEKSFNLSLTPKVAWFVRDDLAIGGIVSLGVKAARNQRSSVNYFVGPLARYYFGEQQINTPRQTRVFAEANAGVSGNNGSGQSTNGFGAGVGPGVAFFVNENIALEALAKANITAGGGTKGVSFAPELSLGFQIYLPTAKIKSLKRDLRD